MDVWTRRMILAATVVTAGCTGQIEAPPGSNAPGTGPGSGAGNSTSTGGSGSSTGGGGPGTGGASGASGASGTAGTGATDPGLCVPGVPGTSQLPRLTKVQYDNTVRDLVGITSQPSTMLAPDSTGSVDQRAWDGYKSAADAVSAEIMANAAARARAIPCTPAGDGAACASQFIQDFGRRAFRRPLTPAETAQFEAMYTNRTQITQNGTFDEAAQLILRSFLISPSFLTRAETSEVADGTYFALTAYEIASRLSYMLWSSMPDETLFAAAAAGALATPEGILGEAQRMLGDPKARDMVRAFHQSYARMGEGTRWVGYQRDPAVYPGFSTNMIPTLSEETSRLFDHLVFDLGGGFQDLLTTPIAFVNATLAPLYGLDPAAYGADLVAVSLDPALRTGVFTRAGFLTAYSLYNRPSAILRGAFIQKHVLCTPIGAPPADAESTPLPTEGLLTNRERTDAQTAGGNCIGCHHGLINPTGFALESFDAIGAYQTTEKDTGAPIDTVATVPVGATEVTVSGPADLMAAIAASPEAQHCYAQHWVEFAYQRAVNSADTCTVDTLAAKLTQGGYTVLNLIADLTQSQSFRYRAVEP